MRLHARCRDVLVLALGLGALLVLSLSLLGCQKEPEVVKVPDPLEDLSTWTLPELVQPEPEPVPVPTPLPEPKKKGPSAELVLGYSPTATYTINVGINGPLDIILGPGEQYRMFTGGDRGLVEANQAERWDVKKAMEGQGDTLRTHLLVTPVSAGLTAGFVLTTTERTYYLTLKSVQSTPIRLVRWRYPLEASKPAPPKEPGLLPDPTQPKLYHVGYELAGKKPSWNPRYVVDDGKKTYIVYPEVTLFDIVPMVQLVGPNGPQLVNARQFLNVVILDQLLVRAELRVGTGETAEVVTITRGAMRTISCPGDEACPPWPLTRTDRSKPRQCYAAGCWSTFYGGVYRSLATRAPPRNMPATATAGRRCASATPAAGRRIRPAAG